MSEVVESYRLAYEFREGADPYGNVPGNVYYTEVDDYSREQAENLLKKYQNSSSTYNARLKRCYHNVERVSVSRGREQVILFPPKGAGIVLNLTEFGDYELVTRLWGLEERTVISFREL